MFSELPSRNSLFIHNQALCLCIQMRLLIAYPDPSALPELFKILQVEEYSCNVTHRYSEVEEWMSLYEFDCIILSDEWKEEGVLRLLDMLERNNKTDGVIIISTNQQSEHRVKLLDHGADDVLSFPFEESELKARIRAVIRRKKFNTKNKLYFANLVIDFQTKSVKVWDRSVNLTKKEYEILLFLISRKNNVSSKTELSEYLWGGEVEELDSFNILFAHLKNLRKKLSSAKAEVEIKNHYGIGYQIIEL